MNQMKKQVAMACVCLLVLTIQAKADTLTDARQAYDSGKHFEAVMAILPLAEQGDPMAQYSLGLIYLQTEEPSKDNRIFQNDKESVKWFGLAANQGLAEAQSILGMMYLDGKGAPQNDTEGEKWTRLAALQNYPDAQFTLAKMYSKGDGVPKDFKESLKWLQLAAKNGNATAQNDLGHKYADGKLVPKDLKAALYWLNKAAQAGVPNAQTSLGWAYMSSEFELEPDYKLAMEWNRKAADQGFGEGSSNIGLLYENGWGMPVNYAEAANWYIKAIGQHAHSGQAEIHLGGLYEKGLGVEVNLIEARKLYQTVVKKFGKGEYAEEAKLRLASMQSQ